MEKIEDLLHDIKNSDLVLPEFQREYIWGKEQAKQLMVSLFKEYPTGSFLFWKTKESIELKNMDIPKEKMGTTKVILDGQQRLTILYLLIVGTIPPYYKEHEIEHDPRKLYFNLKTGVFQYYMRSKMEGDPFWVSVIECFNGDINIFEIAETKAEDDTKRLRLSQQLGDNLTKLRNIKQRLYPIQIVPDTAHIDDAIDIFDLVNSQGTRLSEAELALAHICGKWPQARKVIKSKIKELKKRQFSFNLDFFVRSLTGIVRGRALYKNLSNY